MFSLDSQSALEWISAISKFLYSPNATFSIRLALAYYAQGLRSIRHSEGMERGMEYGLKIFPTNQFFTSLANVQLLWNDARITNFESSNQSIHLLWGIPDPAIGRVKLSEN